MTLSLRARWALAALLGAALLMGTGTMAAADDEEITEEEEVVTQNGQMKVFVTTEDGEQSVKLLRMKDGEWVPVEHEDHAPHVRMLTGTHPGRVVVVRNVELTESPAAGAESETPLPTIMRWLFEDAAKEKDPLDAWFAAGDDVPLAHLRNALKRDGWTADRLRSWLHEMVETHVETILKQHGAHSMGGMAARHGRSSGHSRAAHGGCNCPQRRPASNPHCERCRSRSDCSCAQCRETTRCNCNQRRGSSHDKSPQCRAASSRHCDRCRSRDGCESCGARARGTCEHCQSRSGGNCERCRNRAQDNCERCRNRARGGCDRCREEHEGAGHHAAGEPSNRIRLLQQHLGGLDGLPPEARSTIHRLLGSHLSRAGGGRPEGGAEEITSGSLVELAPHLTELFGAFDDLDPAAREALMKQMAEIGSRMFGAAAGHEEEEEEELDEHECCETCGGGEK